MCVLRGECVQEATKREEQARQAVLRSLAGAPPRVLPFSRSLPSPSSLASLCAVALAAQSVGLATCARGGSCRTGGQVIALSMSSVCLSVCFCVCMCVCCLRGMPVSASGAGNVFVCCLSLCARSGGRGSPRTQRDRRLLQLFLQDSGVERGVGEYVQGAWVCASAKHDAWLEGLHQTRCTSSPLPVPLACQLKWPQSMASALPKRIRRQSVMDALCLCSAQAGVGREIRQGGYGLSVAARRQ